MGELWQNLKFLYDSIAPKDVLDIALLTLIIYAILKFVRETRAGQLLKGVLILVGVYLLSGWMDLNAIHKISEKALSVGLIAIIVLFQPELRRVLEKFGSTTSRRQSFTRTTRRAIGSCESKAYVA